MSLMYAFCLPLGRVRFISISAVLERMIIARNSARNSARVLKPWSIHYHASAPQPTVTPFNWKLEVFTGPGERAMGRAAIRLHHPTPSGRAPEP